MSDRRLLSVVLVVVVLMMTSMVPAAGAAQSPDAAPRAADLAKHTPPEPPQPPSGRGGKPGRPNGESRVCRGNPRTIACWWSAYNPYKSGSDAVGKAYTWGACSGCYHQLQISADMWLWRWVTDHWVMVAQKHSTIYAYSGGVWAWKAYSNAQSAWYSVTSHHYVAYDGDICVNQDDFSQNVWLSF